MVPDTRENWIEIDINAVLNNLQAVRQTIDDHVRLIAVLKANAYGHGACEIAHLLSQHGVKYFAVSFLYEAMQLRKSGLKDNIMLFSPVCTEAQAAEAVDNNITLTIASMYDATVIGNACERLNREATVHLKIDTGLGRFGMDGDEAQTVWDFIKENPRIYLEGIYTHMAQAAANSSYTVKQFNDFAQVIKRLEDNGCFIPVKHCANSAVLLKYPQMRMNAVRVGTLLSGQVPAGVRSDLKLIDPYQFKSRIISVRLVKAGSRLGYYSIYRLRRDALIAVIPVGFSDGLALEVDNKPAGFTDLLKHLVKKVLSYLNVPRFNLYVSIKGRNYPVRGKVFMQMALIELPLGTDVRVGDEVTVPVRKTLASSALTRVYIQDGVPVKMGREERTTYFLEES
ncbi:MAG TPA: alanine racemase [Syntrophomonadaceae bacterium]|nr:alanine racemase [Syntrophomonadaceae bacterium]